MSLVIVRDEGVGTW